MRKRKSGTTQPDTEIFVGYVKSFNFNDKVAEEALGGHPKQGRLYQIIRDSNYGYRLHVGADNTPTKTEGILLGSDLIGTHEDKWQFDVALVTKDNFLDFDIIQEDAAKLDSWFKSENSELKKALEKEVSLVVSSDDGLARVDESTLDEYARKAYAELEETEQKHQSFSDNLNLVMNKDPELFDTIIQLISYLSTTYGDKYEQGGRPNFGKEFLLSSNSPDTSIFNSIKYLQRYCTVGFEKSNNPKDLMKAVHYILFELQRRARQND